MTSRTSHAAATLAAALVMGLASCDSEQPLGSPDQTASVSFSAQARVILEDCYDVWTDTNNDGVPDQDLDTVQCFDVLDTSQTLVRATRPLPWQYSLEVAVVRAGETTETIVASSTDRSDTLDTFVNVTEFDTIVATAPQRPNSGTTYYLNPRQISRGNEEYLNAVGRSYVPNILGDSQNLSYEFSVSAGDTIVVRARKQTYADGTPVFPTFDDELNQLSVSAQLRLDGVSVQPQTGTLGSTFSDGAAVAFSYAVR